MELLYEFIFNPLSVIVSTLMLMLAAVLTQQTTKVRALEQVVQTMEANTTIAEGKLQQMHGLQQLVQALQSNVTKANAALRVYEQSGPSIWKVVLGVLGLSVVGLALWWWNRFNAAEKEKELAKFALVIRRRHCDEHGHHKQFVLCTEDVGLHWQCCKCYAPRNNHGTMVRIVPFRCPYCERCYCGDCAAMFNRQVDKN